ncbi:MAG: hypothetical protein AB7G93_09040 [Bdellovibrionales bacterium]
MRVLIVTMILVFSGHAFAESTASIVNQERAVLMTQILQSKAVEALLQEYGRDTFLFGGMSWVHTPYPDLRYYNLFFRKSDVEVSGESYGRTFTETVTSCTHQVVVKNGEVIGGERIGCSNRKFSVSEQELRGR